MQNDKDLKSFCANIIKHYSCDAVGGYSKIFFYDNSTNTFKHYKDIKIDNKHIYTNEELKEITNFDVEIDSHATVKISKGEFNINSNFIVDQLGNATAKSINIADKIITDSNGNMIIHGGSIKWVSSDPTISQAQASANNALSIGQNAQSMANNANVIATSASGNMSKLANGTYKGGTFIDGKHIESPEITSGEFYGGSFNSFDGNSRLDILDADEMPNANVGAGMALYKGKSPIFYVGSQLIGTTDFYTFNNRFLRTTSDGTIIPIGTWNFNGADEVDFTGTNVKGILARFA